jgi:hypothetical protein
MITDNYEKLHSEYIKTLVEYHNAYIRYIKGNQGKERATVLQKSVRKLRALSTSMIKEITVLKKAKTVSVKDKYLSLRKKKDTNNDNS